MDAWVAILLVMGPVVAAAIGGYAWWIGRPGEAATLFVAGAVLGLVTLALTQPCRYTLLADAISIRCGFICYQIPYADIVSVSPTWTIKSGPALSMRRVEIKTAKRSTIVSPKDRDGFIQDLAQSSPHNSSA